MDALGQSVNYRHRKGANRKQRATAEIEREEERERIQSSQWGKEAGVGGKQSVYNIHRGSVH